MPFTLLDEAFDCVSLDRSSRYDSLSCFADATAQFFAHLTEAFASLTSLTRLLEFVSLPLLLNSSRFARRKLRVTFARSERSQLCCSLFFRREVSLLKLTSLALTSFETSVSHFVRPFVAAAAPLSALSFREKLSLIQSRGFFPTQSFRICARRTN